MDPSNSTTRHSSTRQSTSPTPVRGTCMRTVSPARTKWVWANISSTESARGISRPRTVRARPFLFPVSFPLRKSADIWPRPVADCTSASASSSGRHLSACRSTSARPATG
ncbi:hypothetical protein [Arthrobacter sp. AFG20]|uniref:hypothetical protein n=1 Tax=Arthrobacter sp. AFG20 TaxID=1688671 RepID=UPI0035B5D150